MNSEKMWRGTYGETMMENDNARKQDTTRFTDTGCGTNTYIGRKVLLLIQCCQVGVLRFLMPPFRYFLGKTSVQQRRVPRIDNRAYIV